SGYFGGGGEDRGHDTGGAGYFGHACACGVAGDLCRMTDAQFDELRSIAGPVSRETFQQLIAFQSALLRWNQRVNLVSATTTSDSWRRHILDSAQLLTLAPDAKAWLDLGSGGGLPGIVLGILLKERDGAKIALVESNRKKAGFLQAMIGEF